MQPSSEPTSTAPGLEKRGFERSDRPLARRIDDQDSRHRRCARQSAGGEPHRRTRSRRNAGPQVLTQKIEPAALLADKGYDSDGFIEHLEVCRIKPVIPPRQIARRRASATSRSIASATSWNGSSTSSSTFAPSQPATKRLPETSSQASTSSAPWLGSNDDRP